MWKRFKPSQAEKAALEARIRLLEAELAKRERGDSAWPRTRGLSAALALIIFAMGFGVGVYGELIRRATTDVFTTAFGGGVKRSDFDVANSAYQNNNYSTALQLLTPFAEQGDARAQAILGEIYYHSRGVPQNDFEALKWFHLAAEQGSAPAQLHLGIMHAEGHGVPQDFIQGAKWYRMAADQGYPEAMYYLGLAYARGEGVAQENVSAHMWLNLAAGRFATSETRNRALAARNRDLVAAKMTAEEILAAQTMARDWKAK